MDKISRKYSGLFFLLIRKMMKNAGPDITGSVEIELHTGQHAENTIGRVIDSDSRHRTRNFINCNDRVGRQGKGKKLD
jgi:hypothetical protein